MQPQIVPFFPVPSLYPNRITLISLSDSFKENSGGIFNYYLHNCKNKEILVNIAKAVSASMCYVCCELRFKKQLNLSYN